MHACPCIVHGFCTIQREKEKRKGLPHFPRLFLVLLCSTLFHIHPFPKLLAKRDFVVHLPILPHHYAFHLNRENITPHFSFPSLFLKTKTRTDKRTCGEEEEYGNHINEGGNWDVSTPPFSGYLLSLNSSSLAGIDLALILLLLPFTVNIWFTISSSNGWGWRMEWVGLLVFQRTAGASGGHLHVQPFLSQ